MWCYLCSNRRCHSVDLYSCHQLLKHQWCKPLHNGVQGGCRKFHWTCTLTCDLRHSQRQQCSDWHFHWPPMSQEQDLAHTCARLWHWWEDTALRGDKNEQVWDFIQEEPSALSPPLMTINLRFSHVCTVTSALGRLKHVPVTEKTITT